MWYACRGGVPGTPAVHCPPSDPGGLHHVQAGTPGAALCQPAPACQRAAAQTGEGTLHVSPLYAFMG